MKQTLTAIVATSLLVSGLARADFPEKDIQGVIQWGAGGSTDTVMRSVTPLAEQELGEDIIMTNKSGGVGAIATKYVNAAKGDGYTLLMGAENPQMYKVLGLADVDYGDMEPVVLLARGLSIIVADKDEPYNTVEEFIAYAKVNPGKVRVGTNGPSSLPFMLLAILRTAESFDVTEVPYDGEGPGLTALQSGAIDVMPTSLGAASDFLKSGKMKVIGLIDKKPNPLLPGVAPVTDTYPQLASMLPYGSFFGIFVKKGTPDEALDKLSNAYLIAAGSDKFHSLMDNLGYEVMGINGQDAKAFLSNFQSVASWLVHDTGFSKTSPDTLGIARPE
ncbi:MAG: tripartite tricarboxylate transporter substrate binding protein [Oceanospirillales bacterium]|nr:tripartite tricarboxylate transporter substrate binding protein [Oceanospirillales bacterium]